MSPVGNRLATLTDPNFINIPKTQAGSPQLQSILEVVFRIAGAVAVLIIVMAGIQYIVSQGDPQKTARAKNTILYAAIGLAIALFAQGIVSFVAGKVG